MRLNQSKFFIIPMMALMVIILSFSTIASPLNPDNYYSQSQNTADRRGQYTSAFHDISNSTNYSVSTVSDGSDFQNIIFDLDNDSTNEVIGFEANMFKVWGVFGTSLLIEDEKQSAGNLTTNMIVLMDDDDENDLYDADDYYEILTVTDNNKIYVYEYNGSTINLELNVNYSLKIITSPVCGNFSSNPSCFFGDNESNLVRMNLSDGAFDTTDLSGSIDGFTGDNIHATPPVADIDRDGVDEIGFICSDGVTTGDDVCIIDTSARTLDTYFSGDGIYPNPYTPTAGESGQIEGILFNNMDSAGDMEVVFSYYISSGCVAQTCEDSFIQALTGSGNSYWNVKTAEDQASSSVTYTSMPVTGAEIYQNSGNVVCVAIYWDDTADDTSFVCVGGTNGTIMYQQKTESAVYYLTNRNILLSPTQGNLDYNDIVTGEYIIDIQDGTSSNIYPTGGDQNHYLSIGDMNDDGFIDFCMSKIGDTKCKMWVFDNNAPYFTTFPATFIDGSSPICANETYNVNTFSNSAYFDADGHTVRMAIDCDNDGTYDNFSSFGTSGLTTLSGKCKYRETGTFTIKNTLQDYPMYLAGTYAPLSTYINIYVTSNTDICGLPTSGLTADTTAGNYSGVDTDADTPEDVFDNVFGAYGLSGSWLLVFWLFIMIMITVGMIYAGVQNPYALGLVNLFLLILGNVFGAVSVWVTVLIGMILGLIAVVILFSNREG